MNQILVLCNCNNREEAENIGRAILDKRLASCFDVFKRKLSVYFWPPKSGEKEKLEEGRLLTLTTFEEKYQEIVEVIKKLHSDKVPFISYIKLEGLNSDYLEWMKTEIKS